MEPCSRDPTGVHVRRRLERFGLHRLQGHLLVRRSQRVPLDPRAKPGPRHALPGKKRDRLQQLNKREREFSTLYFISFETRCQILGRGKYQTTRWSIVKSPNQLFSPKVRKRPSVFNASYQKKKKILCVELLELLFPL